MVTKALGKYYFQEGELPIIVYKVNRKQGVTHEHDLTEKLHYHDFTEIVIVLKGSAPHIVEGNESIVSAGDIFVLQGFQKHMFKSAENIEIANVMFDMSKIDKIIDIKTFKKIPGYNALFILEPQIRNNYTFKHFLRLTRKQLIKIEFLVNTIAFEQESKEIGHKTIIKNRLEELIINLSREYSQSNAKDAVALVRISSIIEFMEYHYAEELELKKLANDACMSIRNFQRIFKKATRQSPIDYLILIRLQKAKTLLRETFIPVSEVAFRTGFMDNNYFSRKFRKSFGIPPLKYRARFQSNKLTK